MRATAGEGSYARAAQISCIKTRQPNLCGLSTEIISNLLKSIEAENGELDSTKISFLIAAFRSVHFSKNLAAHEAQSIGVTGHTLHNH